MIRSLLLLGALFVVAPSAPAQATRPHASPPPGAIETDRPQGKQLLRLPHREDAFGFVIYGDRTGGVPAGLAVLDQAIVDTNLLDPDLVMTVGDLIQGYNAKPEWLAQMREFKERMAKLAMPWFPVAGNHDIYFRGPGQPLRHHEASYEAHFGPLWYAFEHKNCWFVVLFSDEGDPTTGRKAFGNPELQRMSPEQFAWLDTTLIKATDAAHVFVFLHHPRWLEGRYGEDWRKVHARLVAAGNVSAVFAGHIHRMRYDGARDGIEYFALATTGGHLSREVPEAGYLHHFNVVTVRGAELSMATVPVGALLDPREITGAMSEDIDRLAGRMAPTDVRGMRLTSMGTVDGLLRLEFENPTDRPIELTLTPGVGDDAWSFSPDHTHTIVAQHERTNVNFSAQRRRGSMDSFRMPRLQVDCDYLAKGTRISMPTRTVELEIDAPVDLARSMPSVPGWMSFDGDGDALRLAHDVASIEDGPFTVECWFRGRNFAGRRGLITKAEQSEYGLFVNNGKVRFDVHLDGAYRRVVSTEAVLAPHRWYHIAGVYDGREVRLYLDGELVGTTPASGVRTRNDLPLYVGADVAGSGLGTSWFDGEIDEFRLSTGARYSGAQHFDPAPRFEADDDTVVLLHLDGRAGPWAVDASKSAAHARCVGDVNAVSGSRER